MIKKKQKNIIKLLCALIFLSSQAFSMQQCNNDNITPETMLDEMSEEKELRTNFSVSEKYSLSPNKLITNIFFSSQSNLLTILLDNGGKVGIDLNQKFNEENSLFTFNSSNDNENKNPLVADGPNQLVAAYYPELNIPKLKLAEKNIIIIWSKKTKTKVETIKTGMKDIKKITWSKDGFWIAAASGNIVKIWQLWPI